MRLRSALPPDEPVLAVARDCSGSWWAVTPAALVVWPGGNMEPHRVTREGQAATSVRPGDGGIRVRLLGEGVAVFGTFDRPNSVTQALTPGKRISP